MKTFDVNIYRNGSFFKEYKESFSIRADYYNSDEDGATFFKYNNGESACGGVEINASFLADKYTIVCNSDLL